MQLDDKHKGFKSMGIPDNMKENIRKTQEAKAAAPKRPTGAASEEARAEAKIEESDDKDDTVLEAEAPAKTADEKKAMTGEELLKSLGTKFDENDFSQVLLKGYFETVIDIIPGRVKAKMRTLLTKEYREIDEVTAKEISDKPMTQDGANARISMWNIAYGVTELNNKAIAKQNTDKKAQKSSTDLAQERIDFFENMSPPIVNMIIKKHGQITWAINNIVNSGDSQHLKNS